MLRAVGGAPAGVRGPSVAPRRSIPYAHAYTYVYDLLDADNGSETHSVASSARKAQHAGSSEAGWRRR